jgi:AraC family transcriptional regulator
MNVDIKRMPELRTAGLRHLGSYAQISEAFDRLHQIVGSTNLKGDKATLLAIYHDDPEMTPEPELRSDAAIVVPKDAQIPAGLREQRLPAGRYACATHVGPYESLPAVWHELLGQWLPLSGERLGKGANFEIYLNTPQDVPKEQLRTELYVPLS